MKCFDAFAKENVAVFNFVSRFYLYPHCEDGRTFWKCSRVGNALHPDSEYRAQVWELWVVAFVPSSFLEDSSTELASPNYIVAQLGGLATSLRIHRNRSISNTNTNSS